MLSVARVTRNIEKCGTPGTFLNFVRFVRGEFMAGSRCCRVPQRESRKVYGERKRAGRVGGGKKNRMISVGSLPRRGLSWKNTNTAEITSDYVIHVFLSLSLSRHASTLLLKTIPRRVAGNRQIGEEGNRPFPFIPVFSFH